MKQPGDGVSVILTAHAEGNLAHRSLRSVLRALDVVRPHCSLELIAILDAPTDETLAYFERHRAHFTHLRKVACEDRGLARNIGCERAHYRYVAFVTATDLISENWLLAACQQARSGSDDREIFHPEFSFQFGHRPGIVEHTEQNRLELPQACLLEGNCWSALPFVARDLALDVPYLATSPRKGWGHSDWHWSCEAIAAGGIHRVVPGTVHFVRQSRDDGTAIPSDSPALLMAPTRLFDQWEESCDRRASASNLPPRTARRSTTKALAAKAESQVRAQLHDRPRLRAAARRVQAVLKAVQAARSCLQQPETQNTPLPDWLVDHWRAQHTIEPQLLPTSDRGAALPRAKSTATSVAEVYLQAAAQWKRDRTHVFLLPWMKRGGSDLVVLHQMRALAEIGCDRQLCITTEPSDSPWLSELPPRTDVLEFGKLAAQLPAEQQLRVLAQLLVQRSPQLAHCINSALGLKLLARHGQALSSVTRLFASMWCPDYSIDGYGGYAYEFLPQILPHLTGVFCDHHRFVDELVETYDFDRARFQVFDFPTRVTVRPREPQGDGRLHVLWASRLDRQKRPDILLQIIEQCQALPVHFHVYGAPALEANRYPARLKAFANVTYHGEYDGFASLPTERFDVLLYTTAWDGLPNVLLEGMGAGLVCVAPHVGGIAELISDENGYLVSGTEAVTEYVQALAELCQNPDRVAALRCRAPEYIAQKRNWPRFVEQVRGNRLYAIPSAIFSRVAA